MDEHLQHLIRKRRAEKCPPGVMANVTRRIAMESKSRPRRIGLRWAIGTVALLLVVTVSTLFLNNLGDPEKPTANAARPERNHQQIIEDAKLSLASIGHLLIAAGQSSETIISENILPPVRGGLQTIKNKLETKP